MMSASGLGRPASSLPRARYPVARNASASASREPSSVQMSCGRLAALRPRTESSPRLISTQFMIQIIWRSWCSDDNATFQPPLSGPSRFSTGTSTSSRKTSQNVSSEIDAIRMGSIRTPGECRSRMRQEMPRCFGASGSVRAYRVHQRDSWAWVVQILWPLTRNTSPSRSARVRRPAKSDPASGSDMPSAHHSSPRSSGTSRRSIWAGVPN